MTGMPARGTRTSGAERRTSGHAAAGTWASGPRAAAVLLALAALAAVAQGAGAAPSAATAGAAPKLGKCAAGELCLWKRGDFRGGVRKFELSGIDIESCERLPAGATAASMANRTGRPVTVYQSAECAETAEFATHPSGTWTPRLPYKGRAFKVWER